MMTASLFPSFTKESNVIPVLFFFLCCIHKFLFFHVCFCFISKRFQHHSFDEK
ncbi:hypothetical protein FTV88_0196 [Heliorestis convoluta]|uniref:Uncharacterized protein n=1 Tax=Heliorestis convoluta TaxID=356322 RepID=A0A5Q2N1F1_9FIRM|nr:hypothetical protein FTV88_0196 [Heliorestis convoluta]